MSSKAPHRSPPHTTARTDAWDYSALEEQQFLLREIFNAIPDIIFFKDTQGRYRICNAALAQYLNMPAEKVLGKCDGELFTNLVDSAEHYTTMDQRAIDSGKPYTYEEELTYPDGSTCWVETVKTPCFRPDGSFMGLFGVSRDVTERKKYEEQLRAARREAEQASRAKTDFLANMSHEIRTPMNAINGFTHLFDRSNLTQTQTEYLEKIHYSSTTLLHIINDLLDLSKVEAGKMALEYIPFHLRGMLDSLHGIMAPAVQKKGLAFTIEVDAAVPDFFVGDPTRLHQIVLNLVNNAVKFTERGSIALRVDSQDAQETGANAPLLRFSVTDTGVGMSEEHMRFLFQPFTQADSSVARRYGGTGLGLSICKHLVELMGGSIGVVSQLGQGSTFSFGLRLPLAPDMRDIPITATGADSPASDYPLARPAPLSAVPRPTLASPPVLVVDDNDLNLEIACALIAHYGVPVDSASSGEQALTKLQEQNYALVFMDMQMPGLDGLETTRHIRHLGRSGLIPRLAIIPIVAMTANALPEDRQRCLDAGMDDHLAKPLVPELLRQCLEQYLPQHDV